MSTWSPARPDLRARGKYVAVAVLLTLVGFVTTRITVIPVFLVDLSPAASLVTSVTLGQLGYLLVGLLFLLGTGRGIDYLDLEVPTQWRVVGAITLGIIALRFAIVVPSWFLFDGFVPAAPAGLEAVYEKGTIMLVMVPLSLFIIAPLEEFMYRGVIQKYLREVFSGTIAVVGAGVLYALIHWFTLGNPTTLDAVITMGGFVIVGISLGWLYERTGTIVSSIIAHGTYNSTIAVSTIVLYHPLVYPGEEEHVEAIVASLATRTVNSVIDSVLPAVQHLAVYLV